MDKVHTPSDSESYNRQHHLDAICYGSMLVFIDCMLQSLSVASSRATFI
jgi:hypothetical protein